MRHTPGQTLLAISYCRKTCLNPIQRWSIPSVYLAITIILSAFFFVVIFAFSHGFASVDIVIMDTRIVRYQHTSHYHASQSVVHPTVHQRQQPAIARHWLAAGKALSCCTAILATCQCSSQVVCGHVFSRVPRRPTGRLPPSSSAASLWAGGRGAVSELHLPRHRCPAHPRRAPRAALLGYTGIHRRKSVGKSRTRAK